MSQLQAVEDLDESPDQDKKWELKTLKPKHREICALLGQGHKNVDVARMTGVTKEYITVLLRMEVIQEEIRRISEIAGVRLEAMFEKSVDVIGDAMTNGSHSEKLKAARLHGELTKRIGKSELNVKPTEDTMSRLLLLAERLTDLNKGSQLERVKVYEDAEEVPFKEIGMERRMLSDQASEEAGNVSNASTDQESSRSEGQS